MEIFAFNSVGRIISELWEKQRGTCIFLEDTAYVRLRKFRNTLRGIRATRIFAIPVCTRGIQAKHFRRFMTGDNLLNGVRIISKHSSRTASFGPSSSTTCSRGPPRCCPSRRAPPPPDQIFIAVTSTSRTGNGPFVLPDREK